MQDKKIVTVFGMLNEKDYEKSLEEICRISDELIITSVPSVRQTSFEEIYKTAKMYKNDTVFIEDNFDAIEYAVRSKNGSFSVLIAGSLYLAGNVRKFAENF